MFQTSQENSGEFEGFISNWKRRSKTPKSSECPLFWIENEQNCRNSFGVVLTREKAFIEEGAFAFTRDRWLSEKARRYLQRSDILKRKLKILFLQLIKTQSDDIATGKAPGPTF